MKKYAARTTIPSATIPRTTPTMVPVFERPPPCVGNAVEEEEAVGSVSSLVELPGAGEVWEEVAGVPDDGGLAEDDVCRQEISPPGMKTTSNRPDWNMASSEGKNA